MLVSTYSKENQYCIVDCLSERLFRGEGKIVVRDGENKAPHSEDEEYQRHERQLEVGHLGFGVELGRLVMNSKNLQK